MRAETNSALQPTMATRDRGQMVIALTAVMAAALMVSFQGFLLLALCGSLGILALVNFDFYLCSIVFLLPWYPFVDWKLPVRDAFLLAHFVLFAGMCVIQQRSGVAWRDWLWRGWLRKGAIAFAGFAILSLVFSESRDAEGAAKALVKLLSYTAVFLTISGWAVTRERITRIIRLLLISTVIVCVFGLYQAIVDDFTGLYFWLYPDMEAVFLAGGGWLGRITSLLFHYNSLAGYLNAVIPLALAVAVLAKETATRRLAFLSLSLSCAATYFTASRGGLVALGALFVFGLFYLRPRKKTMAATLSAVLVASAIVLLISAGIPDRTQSGRLQTMDNFTLDSRLALWGAAGAIFVEHPILGAGFGTYRFALQQYVPGINDQLDAHNLYLQTLAETGVIGFVVFFLMIWACYRSAFNLIKDSDSLSRIVGFAVCGCVGATLIHGMVDYIFIASPQFGNLFWLLLGLGVAARELAPGEGSPAALASVEAF